MGEIVRIITTNDRGEIREYVDSRHHAARAPWWQNPLAGAVALVVFALCLGGLIVLVLR